MSPILFDVASDRHFITLLEEIKDQNSVMINLLQRVHSTQQHQGGETESAILPADISLPAASVDMFDHVNAQALDPDIRGKLVSHSIKDNICIAK
jgi:hypothetical protein